MISFCVCGRFSEMSVLHLNTKLVVGNVGGTRKTQKRDHVARVVHVEQQLPLLVESNRIFFSFWWLGYKRFIFLLCF